MNAEEIERELQFDDAFSARAKGMRQRSVEGRDWPDFAFSTEIFDQLKTMPEADRNEREFVFIEHQMG